MSGGRLWASGLALGLAMACSNPAAPLISQLGQPVELGVGQMAVYPDQELRATFLAVPADSRCPSKVECITAGDATVQVVLATPSVPSGQVELHTAVRGEASAVYAGFTIELLGLAPYPEQPGTIPTNSYRATLQIVPSP